MKTPLTFTVKLSFLMSIVIGSMGLLPTPSSAEGLPEGAFFGKGTFKCFFLNRKILRPYSLNWIIEKKNDSPLTYEAIGSFAIINSSVLHFTAIEKFPPSDSPDEPKVFHLFSPSEKNKQRGLMKCLNGECRFRYEYLTNGVDLPGLRRVRQVIDATWTKNQEGFSQVGEFYYKYFQIPIPGHRTTECKFDDRMILNP